VPRTQSRHAACTYLCRRPPSRSRRSGRMVGGVVDEHRGGTGRYARDKPHRIRWRCRRLRHRGVHHVVLAHGLAVAARGEPVLPACRVAVKPSRRRGASPVPPSRPVGPASSQHARQPPREVSFLVRSSTRRRLSRGRWAARAARTSSARTMSRAHRRATGSRGQTVARLL